MKILLGQRGFSLGPRKQSFLPTRHSLQASSKAWFWCWIMQACAWMWLRVMGAAPHLSKRGKEIHDSQTQRSLSALLEEAKKARRINDKNRRCINHLLAPASPAAATAQGPYLGSRSRARSWSPAIVREDEVWAWLPLAYSSSVCFSAPLADFPDASEFPCP